jgi:hypothetical protein
MVSIFKPGLVSSVLSSGQPVQVADQSMGNKGGIIINPPTAQDQGIPIAETLFVDITGSAYNVVGPTTSEIQIGQWFLVPPLCNVTVSANTAGHKFTSFFSSVYTVPTPPDVVPGTPESGQGVPGFSGDPFPPVAVTGLTDVIPSYLYQEYSDDDDLQGFVAAQNSMQQDYVDTFNALDLPIYTGPVVSGALLDWVGQGLYGMPRPFLETGLSALFGTLNTYGPNWTVPMWQTFDQSIQGQFGVNELHVYGPDDVVSTTDDIYRRILTWHFYKGDGNYFSIRWLKRRIWRFLFGTNGISLETNSAWPDPNSIGDTSQISVTIGTNGNVNIRFVLGNRIVTGGAIPNMFGPNGFGPASGVSPPQYVDIQLNDLDATYVSYHGLPTMQTFLRALQTGVLELPYQFQFTCHIG